MLLLVVRASCKPQDCSHKQLKTDHKLHLKLACHAEKGAYTPPATVADIQ
jgi:hypothetical protein